MRYTAPMFIILCRPYIIDFYRTCQRISKLFLSRSITRLPSISCTLLPKLKASCLKQCRKQPFMASNGQHQAIKPIVSDQSVAPISKVDLHSLASYKATSIMCSGRIAAERYDRALLQRLQKRDPNIKAWVYICEDAH